VGKLHEEIGDIK